MPRPISIVSTLQTYESQWNTYADGQDAQITSLTSQVAAGSAALNTANQTIATRDASIVSLNNQVTSLTSQLAAANATIVTRDATIASLNAQVASLTAQVAAGSQPKTVSLTTPASNQTYTTGQTVTITATVSNASSAAVVEFYNGTTKIGQSAAPYSFTWTPPQGTFSLSAKLIDTTTVTSSTVGGTVNNPVVTSVTTTYVDGPRTWTLTMTNGDGVIKLNGVPAGSDSEGIALYDDDIYIIKKKLDGTFWKWITGSSSWSPTSAPTVPPKLFDDGTTSPVVVPPSSSPETATVNNVSELLAALANPPASKEIILAAGTYYIPSTLKPTAGLTLRSVAGSKAVLSAATPVTNWQAVTDQTILNRFPASVRSSIKCAPIPGPDAWESLLLINNVSQSRARWPRTGWSFLSSDSSNNKNFSLTSTPPPISSLSEVWVNGFWGTSWTFYSTVLTSLNGSSGALSWAPTYGLYKNDRLAIMNAPEFVSQVGDWCTLGGKVYLYATDFSNVSWGSLDILLDSTSTLTLSDLSFVGALCRGANFGATWAVKLTGANSTITRCDISEMAGGGLYLGGGDRPTLTAENVVADTLNINRCDLAVTNYREAGAGLYLDGVGQTIKNSTLRDFDFYAILFGGNDHLILNNIIRSAVKQSGDCGAIYSGGSWSRRRITIKSNLIEDIGGGWDESAAIYFDDLLSGMIAEDNIINRVAAGFILGGGRSNSIKNNKFSGVTYLLDIDARGLSAGDIQNAMADLNTMPWQGALWQSRYPELVTLLNDAPLYAPKNNIVIGNTSTDGQGTIRVSAAAQPYVTIA